MFTRKDSDHAFGTAGNLNVTTTAPITGRFKTVQCLTETVIASYTDSLEDAASDSLAGVTLPAGIILHGDFTAITLTSGDVRLYKYSKSPI